MNPSSWLYLTLMLAGAGLVWTVCRFYVSPKSQESSSESRLPTLLWAIMLAVLTWGAVHAYGAYTFNHNIWRAVVLLGCSLGFLGFWGALLWFSRRRLTERRYPPRPKMDSPPQAVSNAVADPNSTRVRR